MKKILLACIGIILLMQSCYDEYKADFDYTSTYFALQTPLRTLVLEDGEELSFETGVVLAGKYVNDQEEVVNFEIQPSMLDHYPDLELLPTDYYDISNTEFVIKKGEILGTVKVTLNEQFINDPKAHTINYALPIRITNKNNIDSIAPDKDSTVVAIKYHNSYYGAYWIKGVDYTLDASEAPVDTFTYANEDLVDNTYKTFQTLSGDSSRVDYLGADKQNNAIKLHIDGTNVEVLGDETSNTYTNVTGTGTYNKEDRTFTIEYTYEDEGVKHLVKDTLYYFDTPMKVESWMTELGLN